MLRSSIIEMLVCHMRDGPANIIGHLAPLNAVGLEEMLSLIHI